MASTRGREVATAALRLLRWSVLLPPKRSFHVWARRLLGPRLLGTVGALAGASLCAVPVLPIPEANSLSQETLLKRAASLATDGATAFLSQAALALLDSLDRYTKALHTMGSLSQQYVDLMAQLSSKDEESVWNLIVEARSEVIRRQDECQKMEETWTAALYLSKGAAEAAFKAGVEMAAKVALTHLQLLQEQLEEAHALARAAETKVAKVQVGEIQRTALLAKQKEAGSKGSSPQVKSSQPAYLQEEELPEQYLRED
ncbi:diablo IAP-binding mitochondrial protein-like isoform X1 [Petromyzon marinus]|uniref:diablo IAP-binding mitochondrial protein-like isoform X1 n=1 Tax=Petromyzon marinus TaxID=7757 RepID=UPI003F71E3C8